MCMTFRRSFLVPVFLAAVSSVACCAEDKQPVSWTPSGWGGGGFYYSAVFHPTQDGVIYMGSDVLGCYKSQDHGRTWKMINNGIAGYGVFSLAVDRTNPQTVYAATTDGLSKSTDGGEHWQTLPNTGRSQLRITGEKNRSIRSICVDPSDGNTVYAASPAGKVYKSTDGGQTWAVVYETKLNEETGDFLRVQFGGATNDIYGGIWAAVAYPKDIKPADALGFGFSFKGDKTTPRQVSLTLRTANGETYRSRELNGLFANDQWQDVVLKASDFVPDPAYVKKFPDKAAAMPATPDWSSVVRFDFAYVSHRPTDTSVAKLGRFFFVAKDPSAPADAAPALKTVREFKKNKKVWSYGNVRVGDLKVGPIFSVAVAEHNPAWVIAASSNVGLVMSKDAGKTWRELDTPKRAGSVVFAGPKTIYATFFQDGIRKSTDGGKTWATITPTGVTADTRFWDIVASPTEPQQVCVIAPEGWGGAFYMSGDGGKTWQKRAKIKADLAANPTLPQDCPNGEAGISNPRNLAINPQNPQELFIACNWRPCMSRDGGQTWAESSRGADITCVTDIRFSKDGKRTYVSAMDEGALVSEDGGQNWKPLWPMKHDPKISGHNWRLAITDMNGADRILATCSPWAGVPNCVILSEDGGKSYKIITEGLPDYVPTANTMWGRSYPRALAIDPSDPQVLYLGMDGDPTKGKSGGGGSSSRSTGAARGSSCRTNPAAAGATTPLRSTRRTRSVCSGEREAPGRASIAVIRRARPGRTCSARTAGCSTYS